MSRIVLGLLAVVMLSLTGFIAYSTFAPCDSCGAPADAVAKPCCDQEKPSCCTETATADDTPACCKEKANCCETKGEAGACCQGPAKSVKKDDDEKKD